METEKLYTTGSTRLPSVKNYTIKGSQQFLTDDLGNNFYFSLCEAQMDSPNCYSYPFSFIMVTSDYHKEHGGVFIDYQVAAWKEKPELRTFNLGGFIVEMENNGCTYKNDEKGTLQVEYYLTTFKVIKA